MRICFVFSAALLAGSMIGVTQAQSTGSLAVSASAKQVQLRWDENVRIFVERKAPGGTYLPIGIGENGTFTDSGIDGNTIYTYRVSPLSGSASPQVATAGPPPAGFNVVVASPSTGDTHAYFGQMPRLALDQNGDPLVAYFWYNPSGNDNPVDSAIYFTGWNRSQGQFSKPVSVAVTGDISGSSGLDPTVPFALARDASNNTLAIAYHAYSADRTTEYIDIAISTNGGQSWTNKVVTSDTEHFFSSVDVALANGNVYLTYYHDNDGIRYLTGSETANPNTWKSSLAPTVSGYTNYYQVVGLAADSNGVPGIVYILGSATSNNLLIEYWRPRRAPLPIRS